MLLLAKQIYMVEDPNYKCGVKRKLTKTLMLTIDEIDQKLNQQQKLFDMKLYICELNKSSEKKIDLSKTKVMISEFILKWMIDLLTGLGKNIEGEKFRRAFRNLMYFNSIYFTLKPVELLSSPHYHLKLPIRYYQAFFEYEGVISNDKDLSLKKTKQIFQLDNKKNCAYSTYTEFSTSNSIEQLELQYFFLTKKFDVQKKKYSLKMFNNLVDTSIEIVNKQSWIGNTTKLAINKNIHHIQNQIAYSDIIDESIKKNSLNKELTNEQSDKFDLTKYF